MADVKWIKIATDVFDNKKIRIIESMPEGDSIIVIWFKILMLAGNVNDCGNVYFTKDIPFTEQMLATMFNRPLPTVQLALRTFVEFGMIDIFDDIIHVSNWEKYQNIEGMEKIREQTRLRVAKYREKKKLECNVTCNDTVTQGNETDIDIDIDKDIYINKKEKVKKEKVFLKEYDFSDSEIVQSAFNDFLAMRNAMKKPMTERAIQQLKKKLEGLSQDEYTQADILDQSVFKTWQDIYALRPDFVSMRDRKEKTKEVQNNRYADYQ